MPSTNKRGLKQYYDMYIASAHSIGRTPYTIRSKISQGTIFVIFVNYVVIMRKIIHKTLNNNFCHELPCVMLCDLLIANIKLKYVNTEVF